MILGLCQMFHCLPSQLLDEDMDILQLVKIVQYGKDDGTEE